MKTIIIVLISSICFQSLAQNLVPNPSFELFNQCPYMEGQIDFVQDWSNSGTGTSDYYNSCDVVGDVGVPNNWTGFQNAATGEGYCGIAPYFSNAQYNREFIGCTLNSPLIIGEKYYISFKINLCITPVSAQLYATNNIGLLFSTTPYNYNNPSPINNFSHINETNIITDTANWVTIGGTIIADSSYTNLSIGSFFNPNVTDTLEIYQNPTTFVVSYYLIDDVCVSNSASECFGAVQLNELTPNWKNLVRIVDVLGNDTDYKPNTVLIYIYSDGSYQKVFIVE